MMKRAIIEYEDGIYSVMTEMKIDGRWERSTMTSNVVESALGFAKRWLTFKKDPQ